MLMRIRCSRLAISAAFIALLAACSTTTNQVPVSPTLPEVAAPVEEGPLVVLPLSALPETPVRALAGKYVSVAWAELPGWASDDLKNVCSIFLRNCRGLVRPASGNLAGPARAAPRAWQPVCAAAADLGKASQAENPATVRAFLQTWLQPWRIQGADGKPAANTVTGYYEPTVKGSRTRGGVYQWPLYTVPADLLTIDLGKVYPELAGKRVRGKLEGNKVVPFDSRAVFDARVNKPPAIVWVNDPVDNFFLQVQGSGRVQLTEGPDAGQTLRVAYADHNGHPYVSIGKWLADQGELPLAQTSMQGIREWAKRHPNRVNEMLSANPALVFFKEEIITDPEKGPKGAEGIALTAQRSIAVDTTYAPLGSVAYLATTQPASAQPLNRLVFAQDTGTAIKGAARADFYWGSGDEAGAMAGKMKQSGQMWLLWPKAAGAPSAR